MAWIDMTTADIAGGMPIRQSLLQNLIDRDDANCEKPVHFGFDYSRSVGTNYLQVGNDLLCYVPADAKVLRIRCHVWADAAGTTTVKATIEPIAGGSTLTSDEPTTTAATAPSVGDNANMTITLSGLDAAPAGDLRGTECRLKLYGKHSVGTTIHMKDVDAPQSRFSLT